MLDSVPGAQIEITIKEAEEIVEAMKKITFASESDRVRAAFENAEEFLDRIRNLYLPGIVRYLFIYLS